MNENTALRMLLDLALAMVLGGIIGVERELKDRPAGFRTHTLVAGSAALLVCIGQLVLADDRFSGVSNVTVDPLRLVEAVVAGVAFIGAGTIFANRHQNTVSGITTAASLLIVSVVGIAIGFRYYALGFGAAALTLIVLAALERIERRISAKAKKNSDGGTEESHQNDAHRP